MMQVFPSASDIKNVQVPVLGAAQTSKSRPEDWMPIPAGPSPYPVFNFSTTTDLGAQGICASAGLAPISAVIKTTLAAIPLKVLHITGSFLRRRAASMLQVSLFALLPRAFLMLGSVSLSDARCDLKERVPPSAQRSNSLTKNWHFVAGAMPKLSKQSAEE